MYPVHTRIAPTPSGFLHQGNAYNFLLAAKLVKKTGGSLRLRIDDWDAERWRKEYVQDIFDCLRWLDISWHRGPQHWEEYMEFRESENQTQHTENLQRLIETQMVYACTCSRKNLQQAGYTCQCRERQLALTTPQAALKVHVPKQTVITFKDKLKGQQCIDLKKTVGDFTVYRKDGFPSYHLASVTDDLISGTNTIVRGVDLLESTAAQIYLAGLMGYEEFVSIRWYHHPLLLDEHGNKMSKSAGSNSLQWLKLHGKDASELIDELMQQSVL